MKQSKCVWACFWTNLLFYLVSFSVLTTTIFGIHLLLARSLHLIWIAKCNLRGIWYLKRGSPVSCIRLDLAALWDSEREDQ